MKLAFEQSQSKWIEYLVDEIHRKYVYPELHNGARILSYDDFIKPDLYYIDGINKEESPKIYKGIQYKSSEIETFTEWIGRI